MLSLFHKNDLFRALLKHENLLQRKLMSVNGSMNKVELEANITEPIESESKESKEFHNFFLPLCLLVSTLYSLLVHLIILEF